MRLVLAICLGLALLLATPEGVTGDLEGGWEQALPAAADESSRVLVTGAVVMAALGSGRPG